MSYSNILQEDNPLLQIAEKYKREQGKPLGISNTFFRYHEKNPQANLQIKFLEVTADYIKTHLNPHEWKNAQLGVLLVLRALLTDPNPEGKIFDYLVEKLGLDKVINNLLKPHLKFDLMDPQFLNFSQDTMKICQNIMNEPAIKAQFPNTFLKDLFGTIETELEYDHKVLFSMGLASRP